jgi:hypothetical protein
VTIGNEYEIAAQVALSYANADSDYHTATEFSDRLLSAQTAVNAVSLPLAMTASEAKGVADAMALDAFAGRLQAKLALPMAYAPRTPTDVVTVSDDLGTTYRMRLVRRSDAGPLTTFDAVLDDATVVESAGITSGDYSSSVTVSTPGTTTLALMDLPLLRDEDDGIGHYAAATSPSSSWPGAEVWRSVDDVTYLRQPQPITERALIGVATTTLGDWTGGKVFDRTNTVTLSMVYGTPASSTHAAMLADGSINAVAVGDEVIRFQTATSLGGGSYKLSNLLRGQLGTEDKMAGHGAAEKCVWLRSSGLRFIDTDAASVDLDRYYKGVTLGRPVSEARRQTFSHSGASTRCLAPVQLRALRQANGDIVITWARRSRYAGQLFTASGPVLPLGEPVEQYLIAITISADGEFVRSVSTSEQSYTYTYTEQGEDLLGGVDIDIEVRQIGGGGNAAISLYRGKSISITLPYP